MKQKRMDNKGFTLVELIIVMAIMAVLLGIVGTQVIPYLERSREAKDLQIVNSFCTAAVSAYSMNAEKLGTDTYTITVNSSGTTADKDVDGVLVSTITELTGYTKLSEVDFKSKKGQKLKGGTGAITVTISPTGGSVKAVADGFDTEVTADIGKVTA